MEKVSFYKFTHVPLLKNDYQLKQKSDKRPKKKSHLVKKKKEKRKKRGNVPTHCPGNQKNEEKKKERGNMPSTK